MTIRSCLFILSAGRRPRPSGRGGSPAALCSNVTFHGVERSSAAGDRAVAGGPKVLAPKLAAHLGQAGSSEASSTHAFERIDQSGESHLGRIGDEQVDVIRFPSSLSEIAFEVLANLQPRGAE